MLKKIVSCIVFLFLLSCYKSSGQLTVITDLPKTLREVSGTETTEKSDVIWMLNDGGNPSKLYAVSKKGKIKRTIAIKAKNNDWEDLTTDAKGNIYIGDFGNNLNKRKNLVILKIAKNDLKNKKATVKKIKFNYPNQHEYPPKKKNMYFDTEAFFYLKNNLYIFTKSRVRGKYGKTFLYKVPAKKGAYTAKLIGEYENCSDLECWITSADISPNGDKVALLSQKNILIFSNFKGDNFFGGTLQEIPLTHQSQKEAICFKNENTLLITDERAHGAGGNLYELKLN